MSALTTEMCMKLGHDLRKYADFLFQTQSDCIVIVTITDTGVYLSNPPTPTTH